MRTTFILTPFSILTIPNGIPVGVSKAGKSLSATSARPFLWTCDRLSRRSKTKDQRRNACWSRRPIPRPTVSKEFSQSTYCLGIYNQAVYTTTTSAYRQFLEIQIVFDPVSGSLELVHQSHDVEGIEAVENGDALVAEIAEKRGAVPLTTDWAEFVIAPRIFHVAVPRVFHHLRVEREK